jgi:hypothetical protein
MILFCLFFEVADLSTMKKKNYNTAAEQKKKAQREKEAKKKEKLSNLPPKGKKR